MPKPGNVVVYNGRLLPDEATVDFVLWAPGRDYEVLQEPDARILASFAEESMTSARNRTANDGGDDSISGWFIVPDPA
jgi:hypothetical protein